MSDQWLSTEDLARAIEKWRDLARKYEAERDQLREALATLLPFVQVDDRRPAGVWQAIEAARDALSPSEDSTPMSDDMPYGRSDYERVVAERDQLREELNRESDQLRELTDTMNADIPDARTEWADEQKRWDPHQGDIEALAAERDQLREDKQDLRNMLSRAQAELGKAQEASGSMFVEGTNAKVERDQLREDWKVAANWKAEAEQLREALDALIEFAAEQDHSLYVERGEGMGAKYRENDAIAKARAALPEDSTP